MGLLDKLSKAQVNDISTAAVEHLKAIIGKVTENDVDDLLAAHAAIDSPEIKAAIVVAFKGDSANKLGIIDELDLTDASLLSKIKKAQVDAISTTADERLDEVI